MGDSVVMRVAAPKDKDNWLNLNLNDVTSVGNVKAERGGRGEKHSKQGICGVNGCGAKRIYRSVKRFEVGGCCMEHLKVVEAGL